MANSISTTRSAEPEPGATQDIPISSVMSPVETNVEVPFTAYQKAHQKPYSVEYFNLSDYWDDPDGGFTEEINTIETYFRNKIERGKLADDVKSVEHELRELEKINNLKHEERVTVKTGVLASYVKFLMDTERIGYNAVKYGTK